MNDKIEDKPRKKNDLDCTVPLLYDFHFENNQSILDIELFDEFFKNDEFRI
jgi:hypothetical protein